MLGGDTRQVLPPGANGEPLLLSVSDLIGYL